MKKGVTIMEIIKIRAKDAKEIGDALVAELSKGIPEEKREVFREMVETWCKIDDRIEAFARWLMQEPPMWRVVSWHRWKRRRPRFKEG